MIWNAIMMRTTSATTFTISGIYLRAYMVSFSMLLAHGQQLVGQDVVWFSARLASGYQIQGLPRAAGKISPHLETLQQANPRYRKEFISPHD